MIVINSRAGLVHLQSSKGEIKTFQPGKNELSAEAWEDIARAKGNQSSVDAHLKVVDVTEEKDGVEIGNEDINVAKLVAEDAITLIENTIETADLDKYRKQENGRSRPRSTVINAIKEQKDVVADMIKEVEEGQASGVA